MLPTQCLTFLGVLIDIVSECLSKPQEKLVDYSSLNKISCIGAGLARGNCNHSLAS